MSICFKMVSIKKAANTQTTTAIKHWGWVSKPGFLSSQLKNMQLWGGSIYLSKVGPFLIGGSILADRPELSLIHILEKAIFEINFP